MDDTDLRPAAVEGSGSRQMELDGEIQTLNPKAQWHAHDHKLCWCRWLLDGRQWHRGKSQFNFFRCSKILSGKKFPQNVRALRLLAEEILRPMLFNTGVCTMAELSQQLAETSAKSNRARLCIECLVERVFKFMKGDLVTRHHDGLWNGAWSDLFIETTYMRYAHGPSGIIGFTLNESTLAIWAFAFSTLVQLVNDIDEINDGKQYNVVITYKEERHSRIKEDSADRKKKLVRKIFHIY